ncbi:flagellar biosynthesis protein FlhF [Oceanobacillus profundus]|uniref:Flagellar biosynthesis protein FlhF n=1 Tax=Oceanobacillus profundus TaxID=372463 RepID=A0A417YJX7_9BACI|nr:flagellar biosynthesis protein FlhF [Oceanobacillus profundus]RHW33624.1 flagellar biosynthesis protein FlhF [Oceanobacillus profundus]
MKVKKYIADTMPEAMNQVRKELGPDAVILNSKEIQQRGMFGFFKKKQIEVVAALDPSPITPKKNPEQVAEQPRMNKTNKPKLENEHVLLEIKNLKKMIEVQSRQGGLSFSPSYQVAYEHLIDQEVHPKLAKEIVELVLEKQGDTEIDVIMNNIGLIIEERLSNVLAPIPLNKKIIQFVGPTGVGKTTTIAKVAAKMMLESDKKVAFVTADTYRIAAVEQLKTYARILNVPLEVAYSIDDYHQAITKFSSYDAIFVDTAGRNFRDPKYINELKKTIDMSMMETYLVLSLTTKPKDIVEIYEQFEHLSIAGVIFTKLDETRQYGSLLNIALEKQVGIAYLTNGQDVPDDLLEADKRVIRNLLVGDYDEA